jgi:hypothetical protein
MATHITGTGKRDRREKGRNHKPERYLAIEIFLLALVVFFISFAEVKLLTIMSGLTAIFIIIISCLPRYKKIRSRQIEKHTYNFNQK